MTKLFLHNDNASVGRRVSGFVQVALQEVSGKRDGARFLYLLERRADRELVVIR